MTYLDWAATSQPDRQAQEKALSTSLEAFGNASSSHSFGAASRSLLESARKTFLDALWSAHPDTSHTNRAELAFTGSGTEADHIPLLALLSRPTRGAAPHVLVSSIEHAAIFAQAQALKQIGIDVGFVDPGPDGIVNTDRVLSLIKPSTRLVCVMAVNNETGAIQRTGELASALHSWAASGNRRKPHFHVDCVQALGKIPLPVPMQGITSAAFSAHKLGGPKGVGALAYFSPLEALAQGGAQEKGIRSGTENLFGALAFAEVTKNALSSLAPGFSHARSLTERLIRESASITGVLPVPMDRMPIDPRFSPWITSLSFPGLSGEVFARALSDEGIAVSTGSACSQAATTRNKSRGRRVLTAMGIPDDIAFGSIRVSIGGSTTESEIDEFLEKAAVLYRRLKT